MPLPARPPHIPEFPAVHYVVHRLVDLRRDPRWQTITWGSATDGPATEDEAHDAVAECIEDVRAICHAELGIVVLRIEGGVALDVTCDFIGLFPEPEDDE